MTGSPGIPCLLLLFLRSQNVETILENCAKSGISSFFFAIDGPRNDLDRAIQLNLIEKLTSVCSRLDIPFNISILSQNRGILVNMITALECFFAEHDFGVILEDDTIPSLEFIDFVRKMKLTLAESPETMLISGWSGFNDKEDKVLINEVSKYPLIWGWATSNNKWGVMRKWFFEENRLIVTLQSRVNSSRGFWETGFRRAKKGRLDSWANVLAFYFHVHGFKSIVPSYSLVENIGYDEFSTHTSKRNDVGENASTPRKSLGFDDWLEQEVFGISRRHTLGPIYAPILDFLKGQPKKAPPLELLRKTAALVDSPCRMRDIL